ncbi:pectinesterase, partial [Genlisea aurea]
SILVVAMVVAVAVTVTKKNAAGNESGAPATSTSNKAVQAVCSPTSYRETCEQTLAKANTSDPKELIRYGFGVAVDGIGEALKKSALLKQAAADQSTKDAFYVCEDVLDLAVYDLQKSIDRIGEFNPQKLNDYVEDLRTWLSGVVTTQTTCIDAFENTTGDTGEKMKKLLKTVGELTSNGLDMVTDLTSILSQLQIGIGNVSAGRRRLLSDWAEPKMRMLAGGIRANAVVALDGSGQYKSINAAINAAPSKNARPFVIHVKAGLYREYVEVPKHKTNIVILGDGATRTRITGRKNLAGGVKTFATATFAVNADDFTAKDIGIENTAGPEGHQAVALRVTGDRAVLYNLNIDGFQDTLYAHAHRQFYRNCRISGTIDFVFGNALSIFQNCQFIVRKPMANQACMVTAQGRDQRNSNGAIVIQNGEIRAEQAFINAKPKVQAYLGRPWKQFSTTIIMSSYIGGSISPQGWAPWAGSFALDTCYYAEYRNRGPGSNTSQRVKWKGIKHIDPQTAARYAPGKAYGDDQWIRRAGVPYVSGMM